MSDTARLLGVRARPNSVWASRFAAVAARLGRDYGMPSLGNFRDPVKEIFYILLSAKTTDAQYRATHRKLWTAYPRLAALAAARVADIRACIASGGLAGKRGPQIRATAEALLRAGKTRPGAFLKSLQTDEAFAFLRNLPGVGPKSAFCVMMYSLGADVFPVDVNVQRIAERLGAIPKGLTHHQAQRRLAAVVPPGSAQALHVGMVAHGRRVCLPRTPHCDACGLVDLCRRGRAFLATQKGSL